MMAHKVIPGEKNFRWRAGEMIVRGKGLVRVSQFSTLKELPEVARACRDSVLDCASPLALSHLRVPSKAPEGWRSPRPCGDSEASWGGFRRC